MPLDISLSDEQLAAIEASGLLDDRDRQVIGSIQRRQFVAGAENGLAGRYYLNLGTVSLADAQVMRKIIRGTHAARKIPKKPTKTNKPKEQQ